MQLSTKQLDLHSYMSTAVRSGGEKSSHPIYDLIGVSHHSGGMGGGHYTAHCMGANGGWYDFNDSVVTRRNPPAEASSSAYVLFYRRRALPVLPVFRV